MPSPTTRACVALVATALALAACTPAVDPADSLIAGEPVTEAALPTEAAAVSPAATPPPSGPAAPETSTNEPAPEGTSVSLQGVPEDRVVTQAHRGTRLLFDVQPADATYQVHVDGQRWATFNGRTGRLRLTSTARRAVPRTQWRTTSAQGQLSLAGPGVTLLPQGELDLSVVVQPSSTDGPDATPWEWSTTVLHDSVAPRVSLPRSIEVAERGAALDVDLTSLDPEATIEVSAGTYDPSAGTLSFEAAPDLIEVTATDPVGNTRTVVTPVVVPHPGMRAVHTTPFAWDYDPKRKAIIDLIKAGLVDTVQLDIKDESGNVGFDSDVRLANQSGSDATHANFDARKAVRQLHNLGVRVVGRLVVYKDPVLAQWAWNNGRRDYVTQTTGGQPYTGSYGEFAFTNFANRDVQQYNVDIALEATELGFDEILYDYIRRPDGELSGMVFPGIGDRTPEDAVVEMMATAYPLLRDKDVWVGASVFGIAVDRPHEIAQNIDKMAPYVDYISPMVYPDHWGPGEYDISSPVDSPYEIVNRSLRDFQRKLEPTGTAVIPWLASFKVSGDTTVDYVRRQIDATADATGEEWFLLWNPGANYIPATLDPIGPEGP